MGEFPHRARKRFGQNFLHDPAVVHRIVAAIAPRPGQRIVEIGPGQGALTLPLLDATGSLDVVELDRDLIAPLQARAAGRGELRVHGADALKFDFCALRRAPADERGAPGREDKPLRVVGNLPYNISTPLLFHLLEQAHCIEDMHFMLQKEVVERMAARPGGREYGRLSVMVQLRCAVSSLFTIGPGAFRPPPKVDSSVVRLTPHRTPPVAVADERRFALLVSQAFSQRRKTLRNALKGALTAEQMRGLGIDPAARPETLGLAEYAALANLAADAASQAVHGGAATETGNRSE
jgi:16S rRNA (adenine1518-N6/adenine1519-N6)-dimethyltransferase